MKKVRLSSAKVLATAQSEKIESLDIQVDAKTAKMQSSVRSLRERERSMQTIRWSPIFNIKFPTKPDEVEAFEFQFKPQQLQNEITLLKHKITETQLDINEKVSNTYIKIIAAEDEVSTLEARYKKLQNTVGKMEVKVKDGSAALTEGRTETDADGNEVPLSQRTLKARYKAAVERLEKAESRLANCEVELTNARTKLEEAKQSLSNQIGLDVTSGYTFEDAFVTANLTRENVEYLYTYALTDDANVYEAQVANDEALLSLRLNYNLMKTNYPRYIGTIEQYIQQALEGEKINKKSFKADYDKFLKQVDEPWQGSYKIWFISIPKEWLKGDLDGIRYVEDDPYVLYTAALEYEAASKELANAKSDLHNQIFEEYGTYAASRKTYLAANEAYIKGQKLLGLDEVSYLLGELTEEEFETEESEFETLKDDAADALSDFSETLYSFDRTTCGGLSKFFEGSASASSGNAEALTLVPVIRRGCIYTLRPIIDSEEFLLSIDVPDDFYPETGIDITAFELYCDGIQIGERTEVGKTLRHLMVSVGDLGECAIRVYDGNTFIDECRIDPTVFSGPLNITIGYEEESDGHTLGTYVASDEVATDMLVLTLNFDQTQVKAEYASGEEAAYYRICVAEDSYLISDRLVPVNEQFTYLNFLRGDLENVFIEIFDANMVKIGDAKFDTSKKEIYYDVDEDTAAKIAEQKRQEAIQRAIDAENAAAEAEERERRETAMQLLAALGFATNRASVNYALEHLNEITAAVELKGTRNDLQENYDTILKNYNIMKNDPNVPAEDLAAVKTHADLTKKMIAVYDNTLGGATGVMLDELEHAAERYVRQCVAEYAANYQLIMQYTERLENGEKLSQEEQEELDAAKERNAEIKLDLEEFGNDAIEEYEKAILPFNQIIKKIYALTGEELANSPNTLIDLCKKARELIDKMSETGGAAQSTSRLGTAARTVYYRLLRYWDSLTDLPWDRKIQVLSDTRWQNIQKADSALNTIRNSLYDWGMLAQADTYRLKNQQVNTFNIMVYYRESRRQKLEELEIKLQTHYNSFEPLTKYEETMEAVNAELEEARKTYEQWKETYEKYPTQAAGIAREGASAQLKQVEKKYYVARNNLEYYPEFMEQSRDWAIEVINQILEFDEVTPSVTEEQVKAKYDEVIKPSLEKLKQRAELEEQAETLIEELREMTAEEIVDTPNLFEDRYNAIQSLFTKMTEMYVVTENSEFLLKRALSEDYERVRDRWKSDYNNYWDKVGRDRLSDVGAQETTDEVYQSIKHVDDVMTSMESKMDAKDNTYKAHGYKPLDRKGDLETLEFIYQRRQTKISEAETALKAYYGSLEPSTELDETLMATKDEREEAVKNVDLWERYAADNPYNMWAEGNYKAAQAELKLIETKLKALEQKLANYEADMTNARDKALSCIADIQLYHVEPSLTKEEVQARYEEVIEQSKARTKRQSEIRGQAMMAIREIRSMNINDVVASPDTLQSKYDTAVALIEETESLHISTKEEKEALPPRIRDKYYALKKYWDDDPTPFYLPERLTDEVYQKYKNIGDAFTMLETMLDELGVRYDKVDKTEYEEYMQDLEKIYEMRMRRVSEEELALQTAYNDLVPVTKMMEAYEAAEAEVTACDAAARAAWEYLSTLDPSSEAYESATADADAKAAKLELAYMRRNAANSKVQMYMGTIRNARDKAEVAIRNLTKMNVTPFVSMAEVNKKSNELMEDYQAYMAGR